MHTYGRPDLFITFTCNAKWIEVQNVLLPGQTYINRHDLTARVFRLKLIKLMNLITKSEIFGPSRETPVCNAGSKELKYGYSM